MGDHGSPIPDPGVHHHLGVGLGVVVNGESGRECDTTIACRTQFHLPFPPGAPGSTTWSSGRCTHARPTEPARHAGAPIGNPKTPPPPLDPPPLRTLAAMPPCGAAPRTRRRSRLLSLRPSIPLGSPAQALRGQCAAQAADPRSWRCDSEPHWAHLWIPPSRSLSLAYPCGAAPRTRRRSRLLSVRPSRCLGSPAQALKGQCRTGR